MNLAIYTSAACQLYPIMNNNTLKIGDFSPSKEANEAKGYAKIKLRNLRLFSQYERLIPDFFNPGLKLFLVVVTWSLGKQQIKVLPINDQKEQLQLILGKKNSRCLKKKEFCLYEGEFNGKINTIAWLVEAKEQTKFSEIQFDKMTRMIKKSPLVEHSTKTTSRPMQQATTSQKHLIELRDKLTKRLAFIHRIHPLAELSLSKKDIKKRDDYQKTTNWLDIRFSVSLE